MRVLFLAVIFVLAAPAAFAQQAEPLGASMAGIYVQCPRKNPERCPEALDDFRLVFPNGQPHPFFMIRKDGRGYLAPDDRITVDFAVVEANPDLLIFDMDDKGKSKMELRRQEQIWRDRRSGHLYVKAIEDDEWNLTPEPFKNKQKAKKK